MKPRTGRYLTAAVFAVIGVYTAMNVFSSDTPSLYIFISAAYFLVAISMILRETGEHRLHSIGVRTNLARRVQSGVVLLCATVVCNAVMLIQCAVAIGFLVLDAWFEGPNELTLLILAVAIAGYLLFEQTRIRLIPDIRFGRRRVQTILSDEVEERSAETNES